MATEAASAQFGLLNSLEIHPSALPAFSGSATPVRVSWWPHFKHSKARVSMPSDSGRSQIVTMRISHVGQRGRWMGSSSGLVSGMTLLRREGVIGGCGIYKQKSKQATANSKLGH